MTSRTTGMSGMTAALTGVVLCASVHWVAGCSSSSSGPGGAPDAATPPEPVPLSWTLAAPAIDDGAVLSIWGPSDTDVWAVGGQSGQALVLRYDEIGRAHV